MPYPLLPREGTLAQYFTKINVKRKARSFILMVYTCSPPITVYYSSFSSWKKLQIYNNFQCIIIIIFHLVQNIVLRAEKRSYGANLRQAPATPCTAVLIACLHVCLPPPTRQPPASQCSRWQNVNERTNQQTNKHDGSQYLLTEITQRKTC